MKWLLILGASSDVARAVAHTYARTGWNIYLAGRDVGSLAVDASDIEIRYRVKSSAIHFDALQPKRHDSFYKSLVPKPEGVLCAVGLQGDQLRAQQDFRETASIVGTNYLGCVSILDLVAADFEKKKSGFIIGISSVAGDRGRASNYAYGSAKAGFTTYLSGLRNRLNKSNVHVLTVKPGFVFTKMTEGKNLPALLTAEPAQVAADIFEAQHRGADVLYTRWFWRWIMLFIRLIPERVFKRLSL